MKKLTTLLFIGLSAFFILFGSCKKDAPQHPGKDPNENKQKYSAKIARDWLNVTTEMARSMKFSPIQTARLFSYSSLALYESQIPEYPNERSLYNHFSGNTISFDKQLKYFGPVAANNAMAEMLKKFNPDATNLKTIDSLFGVNNEALKNGADPDRINASTTYSTAVVNAIFDWAKTDNVLTPCDPWTPTVGPGFWEPTFPLYLPAVLPCLGNARTFNAGIKTMADPGPPPGYSTDPISFYYENAEEVYNAKFNLTAADSNFINSWLDFQPKNYNTVSRMNKLATSLLEPIDLNLVDAAKFYAKMNVAMFDGIMTTAAGKYKYTLQRPITYIRNVMGHADWNSYKPLAPLPPIPTLPFPSYPSYLGTAVSAACAVMEAELGNNFKITDATQENLYGKFYFKSFEDMEYKTLLQRVQSGQNFRFSVDAGSKSGKIIAGVVNSLP